MANLKSSLKRMRSSERRRVRNRIVRSRTRTFVKKAHAAVEAAPQQPTTAEALRQAISALDRAASKGIIHRNNAARHKARLMRQLHQAQGNDATA